MDDYGDRFGAIGRLYGREAQARIRGARAAVIGIGGVGSWTAEALARSGVGALTLVDLDDVCVSNVNRQLHALDGEVGRPKVDVMAERVRRIHPGCEVRTVHDFFDAGTAAAILGAPLDVVVDAIDHPGQKALLVATCRARGLPVVVCGGAGGRRDPTLVMAADLTDAYNDGLLRRVRKRLRDEHGLPREGRWGVPCVFSRERPVFPTPEGDVCAAPDARTSLRLDCGSGYGTASFVTGAFGLAAAAQALALVAASPP